MKCPVSVGGSTLLTTSDGEIIEEYACSGPLRSGDFRIVHSPSVQQTPCPNVP